MAAWQTLRRRFFAPPYSRVAYVVERKGWSIDWDGKYITQCLREAAGLDCRVTASFRGIKRQVVHFGSRHLYFGAERCPVDRSNRVVVTWFHGSEADPHPDNQRMIRQLPERAAAVDRFVTSSRIGQERLLRWGVPAAKVARIPLGVDLDLFTPATPERRRQVRRALGIPEHAVCVGSFQKDGNGWGEGNDPKLIKGPDILVEVAAQLASRYPVVVLLLGPARGYVKRALAARGVPFHARYVEDYPAIAAHYHALDLYLVTSRDEGGPKSVLEAMASGIPVVSTRVGMAAEVIRPGESGALAEVEDVAGLTAAAATLLEQPEARKRWVAHACADVQAYDWRLIARRYFEEVYRPLLAADRG